MLKKVWLYRKFLKHCRHQCNNYAKILFTGFSYGMNVTDSYNLPIFKAHCPGIRLGRDVCNTVNREFPHYSMFRFGPYIKKGLSRKIISPKEYMRIMNVSPYINPNNYDNPTAYFPDLFNSINKYHCFNCHESALLSALILKLNGIKNAYTAFIRDGKARENHVLCLFKSVPCQ